MYEFSELDRYLSYQDQSYSGFALKLNITMYCVLGTTTAECKSGYGLDVENEVKMLRVLEKAKKNLPIEISSTFCGAHSVPK